MAMTIDVIIPTRERPALMLRNAASARKTAAKPERIKIYAGVDADDPLRTVYISACIDGGVGFLPHPGSGSAPACANWMVKQTAGEIIVLSTDDMIFESAGWDDKLEQIFTAEPYMMVSPNLGRGRKKLEAPICTRKWVDAVGCILGEGFEHFCADEWTERVAQRTGLMEYRMDIVFQHMHPKYGKGEWDDVYKRKRTGNGQANDTKKMQESDEGMRLAAMRLMKAIAEHKGLANAA